MRLGPPEMIWHDGRIIEGGGLRVGIEDRVFEHGLGLFETFCSWGSRAPLLPRHLDRLRRSARDLGIPLVGVVLPGPADVGTLLDSVGRGGDALLRLTVTAGSPSGPTPVAWMTARPLPPPEPSPLRIVTSTAELGDPAVHRHKMLNYWGRRVAFERARSLGADEALLVSPDGRLWEASRNNLLLVPAGRPRTIRTPSLDGPILPGIMRRLALDFAAGRGYLVEEEVVHRDELVGAEAAFLTNSVRGVRPVGRVDDRPIGGSTATELVRLFADEFPRFLLSLSDPDEPTP